MSEQIVTFRRGETLREAWIATDETGTPLDLTGYEVTALLTWRNDGGGISLTVANGGVEWSHTLPPAPEDGEDQAPHLHFVLTPAQTLTVPSGRVSRLVVTLSLAEMGGEIHKDSFMVEAS